MAMTLTEELYRALVLARCRCEYERNSAGVPIWIKETDEELKRKLIQQCSRCKAIDRYELEYVAELDRT